MPDEAIHGDLIEVALQRASGGDFERFVNAFYPSLAGIEFVPLGGNKDGGADAFQDVWAETGEPGVFYQASIQDDFRGKITGTVSRLREFGRQPTALYYITSRRVPKLDVEERNLSEKTSVNVRIRDGAYVAAHINDTVQTRGAFRTHLGPGLEFLKKIGASQVVQPSRHVQSPAVFVFLQQEVERRAGQGKLTEAIVDSLVLWALEGTDPDQGRFLTRDEVLSKIKAVMPFADDLVGRLLDARLKELSRKQNPTGREIRHHRKEGLYCLPFETRLKVQEENAVDEALRLRVLKRLEERVLAVPEALAFQGATSEIANLALLAVQRTFEREGLEFAAFLEKKEDSSDYVNIAECADGVIIDAGIKALRADSFRRIILVALRESFYNSTPEERLLFGKFARTYSLLFSLKAEPRIAAFFQDMASDFYLYVGSDLLVRALSERFVRPEDQRVRTLLRILVDAGATLVLADPVLDEVLHHLRTSDLEFQNYFAGVESKVTYELVRNCPKILIRAFFYARMTPPAGAEPPGSWDAYLRQFCDPAGIRNSRGREELKRYLMSTFSLHYEDAQELESLIASTKLQDGVERIAKALDAAKSSPKLALNDARMAMTVYGRRQVSGEGRRPTEFGFRTWWLTGETSILKHTAEIVRERGARYMMRPEFLLNFIAMVPRLADVRATYRQVFPSLLGMRLADRVKEDVYRDMMKKVREAASLEPGRVEALVAQYSDKLKSDFGRIYEHDLRPCFDREDAEP